MSDGAVKSLVRNALSWMSGSRMQRGKFCDACRSIFKPDGTIGDLKSVKYVDLFSRDIRTLEPQDCHLCAIINYYVTHDEGYLEMQASSVAEGVPLPKVIWKCRTAGDAIFNRFEPSTVHARFHIHCSTDRSPKATSKQFSKHLDCPENWTLANSWVDDCRSAHPACNTKPDAHFMPTRVLFLGEPDDPSPSIRLVGAETLKSSTEAAPHYMTLSHVWGTSETIALTHSTFPQLFAGIPLSTLPPTFRDAVRATRALSVQYLWIDKLCIIQNDVWEWRREAALMESVYRNSFCNIVALDSANDATGFLTPRDPKTVEPFTTGKFNSTAWYDTQFNRKHTLETRAWCLQEQLLSPRLLTFDRRQMGFQCRENFASELFPFSTKEDQMEKKLIVRSFLSSPEQPIPPRKWESPEQYGAISDPFQVWDHILKQYSSRNLSHESDKLYAVSGLARALSHQLGKYAAGLWVKHFLVGLVWRVCSFPGWGTEWRPEKYRAPSWSWASIEGPIWQRETYAQPDAYHWWAELVSVDVRTIDGDDFSQVLSGEARLRGRLKKATWEVKALRANSDLVLKGRTRVAHSLLVDDWDSGAADSLRFDVDTIVSPPPAEILLFPILHPVRLRSYEKKVKVKIHGLVLENVEGGRFRRLGAFDVPWATFGGEIGRWEEAEVSII